MEIRQLEYVVGVVDHGGFTRAAAALHVSQPALSEGVARIEAELGVALFDRVGRQARPTAAGTAFLEPARQVLRDLSVLRTSVASVVGLEAGTLDLVALPTLAVDPLAPLVGAFRRVHPNVVVRVHQPEDPDAVATRVRSGQAEIGLTELPLDVPGLVTEVIAEQELVVVLPPGSPLASRRRLTAPDLTRVPLVTSPPGTSTRRIIDAAFAAAGGTPLVAVETDQREAIIPLVLAGAGATFLPRPLAATATARGAIAVPLSPRLRRSVGLVWRAGAMAPASRAFVSISREPRT